MFREGVKTEDFSGILQSIFNHNFFLIFSSSEEGNLSRLNKNAANFLEKVKLKEKLTLRKGQYLNSGLEKPDLVKKPSSDITDWMWIRILLVLQSINKSGNQQIRYIKSKIANSDNDM